MKYLTISLALLLTACGAVKPANPQQAIFQLESALKDGESLAALYDSLPSCTNATTIVCSQSTVAVQLKAAKDVAETSVFNAEKAVRDPNFGTNNVNTAIVAAQAAVSALTALTALEAVQTAIKGAKK